MTLKPVYLLVLLAALSILALLPAGVARFAVPGIFLALVLATIVLRATSVVGSVRSRDWGNPGLLISAVGFVLLAVLVIRRLG